MKKETEGRGSSARIALLMGVIGIILVFALMAPLLGGLGMLSIGRGLHGSHFPFAPVLPLGMMTLIQIGLAIWVAIDANRRGLNGVLWGLLVLFTSIVGLVVYLLVGPSHATGRGGSGILDLERTDLDPATVPLL